LGGYNQLTRLHRRLHPLDGMVSKFRMSGGDPDRWCVLVGKHCLIVMFILLFCSSLQHSHCRELGNRHDRRIRLPAGRGSRPRWPEAAGTSRAHLGATQSTPAGTAHRPRRRRPRRRVRQDRPSRHSRGPPTLGCASGHHGPASTRQGTAAAIRCNIPGGPDPRGSGTIGRACGTPARPGRRPRRECRRRGPRGRPAGRPFRPGRCAGRSRGTQTTAGSSSSEIASASTQ